MAGTDYESILCVKPQVHVFRIPPRPSNRGYRASDWKLDQPDWTGRLRVVSKGSDLFIKLEDKTSGELFAKCPVEQYPGIAVESVTDSSRYFVLRIMDDNGRTAFIGIGFEDRGDSFDLNVALQDHFKHIKQEKDAEKAVQELEKGPKLDLGFKEGQTIRINIATKKNKEGEDGSSSQKSRPRGTGGGGGLGMLPPPPGGIKLPPPGGAGLSNNPSTQKTFQSPQHSVPASNPSPNPGVTQQSNPGVGSGASNVDLLLNFDSPSSFNTPAPQSGSSSSQNAGQNLLGGADSDFDLLRDVSKSGSAEPVSGLSDPWGDFTSASNSSGTSNDDNWVQF